MTMLSAIAKDPRVRMLFVGRPKVGKTGALACLANAGYEIGVLDFDNNPEPLAAFVLPQFQDNVSVLPLEDKMQFAEDKKGVWLKDEPLAFRKMWRALEKWPDKDWGPVNKWGRNRILVLDSASGMGDVALKQAKFVNNHTPWYGFDSDYSLAMSNEESALGKLTSNEFNCHVIVICHMKMIGPKVERETEKDKPEVRDAKALISKANAETIPTRWYPAVLGRALPQVVAQHFPIMIQGEIRDGRRVILTQPQDDFELGVPVAKIDPELPLNTGLLTIFNAVTGGLKA